MKRMRTLSVLAFCLLGHLMVSAEENGEKTKVFRPVQEEAQMGKMWKGAITRWELGYMVADNDFSNYNYQIRMGLIVKGFVIQADISKYLNNIFNGENCGLNPIRGRFGLGYNYRFSVGKRFALDLRGVVGYARWNEDYAQRPLLKDASKDLQKFMKLDDISGKIVRLYSDEDIVSKLTKWADGKEASCNPQKDNVSYIQWQNDRMKNNYHSGDNVYLEIAPSFNYVFSNGGSVFVGYSLIANKFKVWDDCREGFLQVGFRLPFN